MSQSKRRTTNRSNYTKAGTYRQAKSRTSRQGDTHTSSSTPGSILATIAGIGLALLVVLGFVLIGIIGHEKATTTASGGGPGKVPAGYGSLNHAKGPCGNAGQAACPAAQADWFSITAASPTGVAAAIAHSLDYLSMQAQYGYVALDTPALVHAYDAHTGIQYYDSDHWVVSVRVAHGLRCGLFDFVYDRTHQQLRFSSFGIITPSDPRSKQPFPYISESTALTVLSNERGMGAKIGIQPELIFFPIDPSFPNLSSPVHKWAGGGNSPMLPMWYIVGSDNNSYFVGTDLHTHPLSQLPIAKGQP
jgi:hypothetical protein